MEKRPYDSRDSGYSRVEKHPRTDSYSSRGESGGYSSSSRGDSNSYTSRDSNSYASRGSDSNSYASKGSDSYGWNSRGDSGSYPSRGDSRNDSTSYSSSRSDFNSYSSRSDDRGYNSYSSRGDSSSGYRSQGGGYNSRGRGGGGRFQSGGYGSQNGDTWSCSSCRFSNYASRTSCYKCKNPKDGGGSDSRQKWGSSDSSSWKKPSWGDSKYSGNGRDRSYSNDRSSYNSWKKSDSWGSKDRSDNSGGLIDWDDLSKNEGKYEAERWAHLPEIVKDVYVEDPTIAAMTEEAVKALREENLSLEVNRSDKETVVPNPVQTFEQAFSSHPRIISEIKRQGFENPSAIQCQAWPILMKGYDMIGTSQTGSGKTLAFLLPALLHIVAQPTPRWERIGPTCLVLAPTRELAQQIERETLKFQYDNIRCVCCYGQGDKRNQIQKLNAMSEIVIATPGRLNDFVEQGVVNLSGVSYLVLDEGDRMLDMGFEPQVRKIVINIRPDRQTILTSATWPSEVRKFADKLMKNPIHVIVGSLDLQAVDTITQRVIVCSIMDKEEKLMDFVRGMKHEDKAIVFVAQKITVDHLSVKLLEAGISAESMHGGRNQRDREYSLRQLKTGRSKVLIATDVAARGIDINDITHVLNYDCPKDMEEYVHRVGRTGRAGRSGQSLTLMCRDDLKVSGKLIEILDKSNQEVPPELTRMKERWERVSYERGERYGRHQSRFGGGGGGGSRNGWFSA